MSNTAKINTVITNNNSDFIKGITQAKQQVEGFAKGQLAQLGGMIGGAFAVGAVVEFGRRALENADNLSKLSETVGITTDQLQGLQAAAKLNGMETTDIDAGLAKLAKAQDEVVQGNKAIITTFQRLGISAQDAASMGTAELFDAIAKGAQNDATAIADLSDIFGRGMGTKMMPILKEIADNGFGGIVEKAKQAGLIIDSEVISKLAEANDDFERIQLQASNWLTTAGAGIGNFISDFSEFSGRAFFKNVDDLKAGKIKGWLTGGNAMDAWDEWGTEFGSGAREKARKEKDEKNKADIAAKKKQKAEQYEQNRSAAEQLSDAKAYEDYINDATNENLKAIDKQNAKDAKQKSIDKATEKENERYGEQLQDAGKVGLNIRAADSLATTGRFVGAQSTGQNSIADRQLKVAERMEKLAAEHNRKLAELVEKENELKQTLQGE